MWDVDAVDIDSDNDLDLDGNIAGTVISISADGVTSWSEPTMDKNLPDPVCMGSICRLDKSTILFSNCASHEAKLAGWARDRMLGRATSRPGARSRQW